MGYAAHRPAPESPGRLNIGCGPFNAPHPWWNIDLVETNHPDYPTRPDEVVPRGNLSRWFGPESCTHIYCGHLLEHVPWGMWGEGVTSFLQDVRDLLVEGGRIAFVGPDVFRAITMWHEGTSTWEWVVACMENMDAQFDLQEGRVTEEGVLSYVVKGTGTEGWAEARHKWNCYEDRMLYIVRKTFPNAVAVPIDERYLGEFPLVAYTQFQCAVVASR